MDHGSAGAQLLVDMGGWVVGWLGALSGFTRGASLLLRPVHAWLCTSASCPHGLPSTLSWVSCRAMHPSTTEAACSAPSGTPS